MNSARGEEELRQGYRSKTEPKVLVEKFGDFQYIISARTLAGRSRGHNYERGKSRGSAASVSRDALLMASPPSFVGLIQQDDCKVVHHM